MAEEHRYDFSSRRIPRKIPYRISLPFDNGEKLVKDFKGHILVKDQILVEDQRLVTELSYVEDALDNLRDFFRRYEGNKKTVSCRGMDYFTMQSVRFRNGLYVVGDVREISLPAVYHTHDERFNKFREGSVLKL